jgi:hypothetical protein
MDCAAPRRGGWWEPEAPNIQVRSSTARTKGPKVRRPNERRLRALQAIRGNDQGQSGDLEIFEARECEDLGWATKVGGAYRLTEEGKRQIDEVAPTAA